MMECEETELILGLDLGATNVKLGLVSLSGRALYSSRTGLKAWGPDEVCLQLKEDAEALLKQAGKTWDDIVAVGIGAPGQIRAGCVVAASNFPTWSEVPLAQIFAELSGKPTTLINDADAAALGEVWAGSASGRKTAVLITLGSGVGTGVVVDGKVMSGTRGLVEGGHMILQLNGRLCGCGQRGCLEAYASGNSIATRATEALENYEGNTRLRSSGTITAKSVFDAARAGDPLALEIRKETVMYLGLGCLTMCRLLDPEVIIFAGGVAEAGPELLALVQEEFSKLGWSILDNKVEMVMASLGPDTGIIGAAAAAATLLPHKI